MTKWRIKQCNLLSLFLYYAIPFSFPHIWNGHLSPRDALFCPSHAIPSFIFIHIFSLLLTQSLLLFPFCNGSSTVSFNINSISSYFLFSSAVLFPLIIYAKSFLLIDNSILHPFISLNFFHFLAHVLPSCSGIPAFRMQFQVPLLTMYIHFCTSSFHIVLTFFSRFSIRFLVSTIYTSRNIDEVIERRKILAVFSGITEMRKGK